MIVKRQMELIADGIYEALCVLDREALGTLSIRKALESPIIQELLRTNTFYGELFYKKVPNYSMEKFLCVDMQNIAIRITDVGVLDDDVTIRIRFSSDLNSDFIMNHCKIAPRIIGQFATDLMSYTDIRIVTFDLIADVNKPITVEEAIDILQAFPKDAILTDKHFKYISSIGKEYNTNTSFVIVE